MRISVCLGIYNGEKYIEQQLTSLLRQTRQPDEVILCDDGSVDSTADKVRTFIVENHLEENWRLYCNQENKGYPANFYHCMELCQGDIVFLGDQDDIWSERKLEKMMAALEEHPKANVIACKYELIDSENRRINALTEPVGKKEADSVRRISIHDIFYRYQWPGMVLAYRNTWYSNWKKCYTDIPHDIFICAKAAEEESFFQLNEVLAYHRRHENNTAAEEHRVRKLLSKKRKLWEIEKYLKMLEQFKRFEIFETDAGREALVAKLRVMRGRYDSLCSGKISMVLKNALKDRKSVRLATVLCDLIIVKMRA